MFDGLGPTFGICQRGAQVPYAVYFNASYDVLAQLTYAVDGQQGGTSYYTTGGVYAGVSITPTVTN